MHHKSDNTLYLFEVLYHAYLVFLNSHPNIEGHSTCFFMASTKQIQSIFALANKLFLEVEYMTIEKQENADRSKDK